MCHNLAHTSIWQQTCNILVQIGILPPPVIPPWQVQIRFMTLLPVSRLPLAELEAFFNLCYVMLLLYILITERQNTLLQLWASQDVATKYNVAEVMAGGKAGWSVLPVSWYWEYFTEMPWGYFLLQPTFQFVNTVSWKENLKHWKHTK